MQTVFNSIQYFQARNKFCVRCSINDDIDMWYVFIVASAHAHCSLFLFKTLRLYNDCYFVLILLIFSTFCINSEWTLYKWVFILHTWYKQFYVYAIISWYSFFAYINTCSEYLLISLIRFIVHSNRLIMWKWVFYLTMLTNQLYTQQQVIQLDNFNTHDNWIKFSIKKIRQMDLI